MIIDIELYLAHISQKARTSVLKIIIRFRITAKYFMPRPLISCFDRFIDNKIT